MIPTTCGPVTLPDGSVHIVHVVRPGASACVCSKHIGAARAQVRRALGLDRPDRPERDPDHPCPSRDFEPGSPGGACETDGHYVCRECVHADPEALAERDRG